MTGKVEIHAWSPGWAERFEAEKRVLLEAFRPEAIEIEHIGSTAVRGLAAKPIVDMLLGAADLASIERRMPSLVALGYRYVPEFEAELPGRRYFVKPAHGAAELHLHAVRVHDGFWSRHLAFRDALREDSHLAAEYAQLKRRLAARFGHDRGAYTDAKSDFIRRVIDAAAGAPRHR